MKRTALSLSVGICLLIGGFGSAIAAPPQGNQCSRGSLVQPKSQLKTIRNQEHGFAFNLPVNYSARRESFGANKPSPILVLNPTDAALLDCGRKYRVLDVAYATEPIVIDILSLDGELLPPAPYTEELERQTITIAGQKAIFVKARASEGVPNAGGISLKVAVPAKNGRDRIVISFYTWKPQISAIHQQVFNQIVSSLSFR